MQSDVEHSRALGRMSRRLKLERDLQLADCEVVAEIVGYGGDWAEWVGGDGSVKLGNACRVQLPAHQLQVAQVPEAIWGVTEGQAGFSAGGVGGSPMIVGSHSLREVREVIREETCHNLVVGWRQHNQEQFSKLGEQISLSSFDSSVRLMSQTYNNVSMLPILRNNFCTIIIIPVKWNEIQTVA